jgi:hypothetical protein
MNVALFPIKNASAQFRRVAILLCLAVGFAACMRANHNSAYVPFGVDLYHLSSLGAWAFACAAGSLLFRRNVTFSERAVDAAARAMWEVWQASDLCREEHRGISWETMVENSATNCAARAYVQIGRLEARKALEAAFMENG